MPPADFADADTGPIRRVPPDSRPAGTWPTADEDRGHGYDWFGPERDADRPGWQDGPGLGTGATRPARAADATRGASARRQAPAERREAPTVRPARRERRERPDRDPTEAGANTPPEVARRRAEARPAPQASETGEVTARGVARPGHSGKRRQAVETGDGTRTGTGDHRTRTSTRGTSTSTSATSTSATSTSATGSSGTSTSTSATSTSATGSSGTSTNETGPAHGAGTGPDQRTGPATGSTTSPAREPGHGHRTGTRRPGTAHGHGHGHTPAAPASRRVRLLLIWILGPLALATVVAAFVLYPWGTAKPASTYQSGTPVHGTITTAVSGPCLAPGQVHVGDDSGGDEKPCLTVDVAMTDGAAAGSTVKLVVPIEPSTPRFSVNDDVVLSYNGGDARDPSSYQLVDFQRGLPLALLAGLFAIAVVVLGRWRGLAALGALVLSFVVLVLFVLPAILGGQNPLLVAIVGAGVIMFIALYLTHGLSARTSVAVLGTIVSLALIGVLSAIFSAAASLTGLDDSTSTLIGSLGHGIDTRGLLLAGIVIGALGVLDDVTVTQTSAVWELRRANPTLGWRELYGAGLRIGRDHVGSAVNTLVMAYAGAALPVMLYSSISGVGLGAILGSQDVAQEIVRTLAGSVGIVAAVPVTTVLAALIASQEKPQESHQ